MVSAKCEIDYFDVNLMCRYDATHMVRELIVFNCFWLKLFGMKSKMPYRFQYSTIYSYNISIRANIHILAILAFMTVVINSYSKW